MESNHESILISNRCLTVKYDLKISDRITVILPNAQMAALGLVTKKQQIEINKSIRCYTDGKDSIEWSMVGIKNGLDTIRALRKFKKMNNTYFNKICIYDTERLGSKMIFYLDVKKMIDLKLDWEWELIRDFEKNHLFCNFESIVINRRIKKQNKSINNDKNKIGKNLDTIEAALQIWDMQIMNIKYDIQNRQKKVCKFFVESDVCLKRINNIDRRLDSFIGKCNNSGIESYLNKIKKSDEREIMFNQGIEYIQNKLKLMKENIQKQEVEIKEREKTSGMIITKFEIDIVEMKKLLAKKKVELINNHVDDILIQETQLRKAKEMFKNSTNMFSNLNNLDSSDILQIASSVESSVNFHKQLQKQNEIVQGYEFGQNYLMLVDMQLNTSTTPSKINENDAISVSKLFEENSYGYNTIVNINIINNYASIKTNKLCVVLSYVLCKLGNKLFENVKLYMQGWYDQTVVIDDNG